MSSHPSGCRCPVCHERLYKTGEGEATDYEKWVAEQEIKDIEPDRKIESANEINAMAKIHDLLEPFDSKARVRMLWWVKDVMNIGENP